VGGAHGQETPQGWQWHRLSPDDRKAAASRDPVVVLPLAATEQHGPHLPVSTDVDIGEGILASARSTLGPELPVFRLPMQPVGVSTEHADYPGTVTMPPEELQADLVSRGAGLASEGVRRLVLFNSHGGNKAVVDTAALRLRFEVGMLVVKAHWFRFPRPGGLPFPESEWVFGLHGGGVETAMMLHLHPERVARGAAARFRSLGEDLAGDLSYVGPEGVAPFAWMARDLNPQGVTGDASMATPDAGRRLVEHYGGVLADVIRDTLRFPLDRLARRGG
jgi:creatinine amidohydrolase